MLAGTRMHAHAGKIPAPGTASSLSPSSSARLLLGICGCARVNEDEQRKRPAKTTDFCTRPHMCLLAGTALPQRHLEVRLQRHVLTSASILLGGEKKNLATTGAPACTHHACRSGKARQAHGQCVCPLPIPAARHTTHSAFSARLGFCASAAALPASNATSDLAVLSRVATGACAGTVPGDELHGIRAGSQGLSALRVVDRASFCRCEQAGRARCGGKRRPCTRLRAPM